MTLPTSQLTSLATLALLAGLSTSAFAQSRATYIVQLAAEPVAGADPGVHLRRGVRPAGTRD